MLDIEDITDVRPPLAFRTAPDQGPEADYANRALAADGIARAAFLGFLADQSKAKAAVSRFKMVMTETNRLTAIAAVATARASRYAAAIAARDARDAAALAIHGGPVS